MAVSKAKPFSEIMASLPAERRARISKGIEAEVRRIVFLKAQAFVEECFFGHEPRPTRRQRYLAAQKVAEVMAPLYEPRT